MLCNFPIAIECNSASLRIHSPPNLTPVPMLSQSKLLITMVRYACKQELFRLMVFMRFPNPLNSVLNIWCEENEHNKFMYAKKAKATMTSEFSQWSHLPVGSQTTTELESQLQF